MFARVFSFGNKLDLSAVVQVDDQSTTMLDLVLILPNTIAYSRFCIRSLTVELHWKSTMSIYAQGKNGDQRRTAVSSYRIYTWILNARIVYSRHRWNTNTRD